MPDFRWQPYEFIEFFGAAPEIDDYETSHRVVGDDNTVTLELTVWKYESVI